MAKGTYEWVDHTADFRLLARASSMADIFALVADAMFGLILDRSDARPVETVAVAVDAPDREALMVQWLNELLYVYEVDEFVPVEFIIGKLSDTEIAADIRGERLDPDRHEIQEELKAATYHHLRVEPHGDEWRAEVVFDT